MCSILFSLKSKSSSRRRWCHGLFQDKGHHQLFLIKNNPKNKTENLRISSRKIYALQREEFRHTSLFDYFHEQSSKSSGLMTDLNSRNRFEKNRIAIDSEIHEIKLRKSNAIIMQLDKHILEKTQL